jgi:hypothetical protein
MSMPINPLRDFVGRVFVLLTFSSLSAISVVVVGYACGARFSYTIVECAQAIGFIALIFIASAGIGRFCGDLRCNDAQYLSPTVASTVCDDLSHLFS